MNKITLVIISSTLLVLQGCLAWNGQDKLSLNSSASQGDLTTTLTLVNLANNQFTLTGTGFSNVTNVKIKRGSLNASLDIVSKSDTQIIARATSALSLLLRQSFDLIIANASAQVTYPITFTLQDGDITNITPDADFTLTQNSAVAFRSVETGAVANTLRLQEGKVGIGTSGTPLAKLEVKDGTVLFNGTTGSTPTSGAGTRFMWVPGKSAIRAGAVGDAEWNDVNIGTWSTGFGYGVIASGAVSTAIGGYNNATASYATALGALSVASGEGSTTLGYGVTAYSLRQTTVGSYNLPAGTEDANSWVATDPLFVIGNGTASGASRSNAVTVLKNGNVGIGTPTPSFTLDVAGSARATGSVASWSDSRVKKNIHPLKNSLEKILKLNGVSFEWRNDEFTEKKFKQGKDIGVIAQNVETQYPEVVETDRDTYKSVSYPKLIAPLIEAFKQFYSVWKSDSASLRREVTELRASNQEANRKLAELNERLLALEKAKAR